MQPVYYQVRRISKLRVALVPLAWTLILAGAAGCFTIVVVPLRATYVVEGQTTVRHQELSIADGTIAVRFTRYVHSAYSTTAVARRFRFERPADIGRVEWAGGAHFAGSIWSGDCDFFVRVPFLGLAIIGGVMLFVLRRTRPHALCAASARRTINPAQPDHP